MLNTWKNPSESCVLTFPNRFWHSATLGIQSLLGYSRNTYRRTITQLLLAGALIAG
jgi:hypothetical protein